MKLLEKEEKDVTDNIDTVLRLQSHSRELLTLTSPHLVNDFKRVKLDYEELCHKCDQALAAEYCVTSSEWLCVKEIIDKMGKEIDLKLKSVFIKKGKLMSPNQFVIMGTKCINYAFAFEQETLKIYSLKLSDLNEVEYGEVGELGFEGSVKLFFPINDFFYLCSCVIITHSSSVWRIDVNETNVCKKTALSLPSFEYLLCAYVIKNNSTEVSWCYWSEEEKVLIFSHKPSYRLDCHEILRWGSLQFSGYQLCFTLKNQVLIVDPLNERHEWVRENSGGLRSIDHVTLYNGHVFIWSVDAGLIRYNRPMNRGWCHYGNDNQRWSDPTTVISLNSFPGLQFLPTLDNSRSGRDYDFITFIKLA